MSLPYLEYEAWKCKNKEKGFTRFFERKLHRPIVGHFLGFVRTPDEMQA